MDEFTEVACTECKWEGMAGELHDSAYQPKVYDRCPECGSDEVVDEYGDRVKI